MTTESDASAIARSGWVQLMASDDFSQLKWAPMPNTYPGGTNPSALDEYRAALTGRTEVLTPFATKIRASAMFMFELADKVAWRFLIRLLYGERHLYRERKRSKADDLSQ